MYAYMHITHIQILKKKKKKSSVWNKLYVNALWDGRVACIGKNKPPSSMASGKFLPECYCFQLQTGNFGVFSSTEHWTQWGSDSTELKSVARCLAQNSCLANILYNWLVLYSCFLFPPLDVLVQFIVPNLCSNKLKIMAISQSLHNSHLPCEKAL